MENFGFKLATSHIQTRWAQVGKNANEKINDIFINYGIIKLVRLIWTKKI